MPIYDYVCANGHTTEVIHGVNDPGPASCPVCGAPLRKAMSAPTVHFKGSGWAKKERSTTPAAAKSGDGDKSRDADKSGDADKSRDGAKSGDGDKSGAAGSPKTSTTGAGETAKKDSSSTPGSASSEAS